MRKKTTRLMSIAVGAVTGALTLGGVGAPGHAAPVADDRPRTTSLAEVLAADGTRFDKKWADFDILEAAVYAVLEAKPSSPVGLLADGKQRLTAFVPTDAAFRQLVRDLTGKAPGTEERTLRKITEVADIDTIESILLYHVLAGSTLTSPKVVHAAEERTKVKTALGLSVKVLAHRRGVMLVDRDRDSRNAFVELDLLDINRGSKQVAHGIDRVLRPLDL